MAHSSSVTCLALGPSSGRVMVTGGEDRKVNMWAVGKPNVIMVCPLFVLLLFSVKFIVKFKFTWITQSFSVGYGCCFCLSWMKQVF